MKFRAQRFESTHNKIDNFIIDDSAARRPIRFVLSILLPHSCSPSHVPSFIDETTTRRPAIRFGILATVSKMASLWAVVSFAFSLMLTPFLMLLLAIIFLASIGKSLGVRRLYIKLLLALFEVSAKSSGSFESPR